MAGRFALHSLSLLAVLANLEKPTNCFTEEFHLDYYDCCRDSGPDGKPALQNQCFNREQYTFEACCNYRFGPSIRGLPHVCGPEVDGIAQFDMGATGRMEISCTHVPRRTNDSSAKVQTIWFGAWLVAGFLLDLDRVVDHSRASWAEGLDVLQPLQRRPLKILDVGCGTGVMTVALARGGHEVTAADYSRHALATTRVNLRRNKVRASTVHWDMMTNPDSPRLQQRFDVVFAEVASIAMQAFQHGTEEDYFERIGFYIQEVLNHLLLLDTYMFIFVGVYFRHHPTRLEVITASLLYALENLGKNRILRRPCEPGSSELCARAPRMTPKYFLSELGLGPPTSHGIIVW